MILMTFTAATVWALMEGNRQGKEDDEEEEEREK